MATNAKSDDSKVQVHHTKRGVLYADPEQILRSKMHVDKSGPLRILSL